ncbi:MAG: PLxRFG domain-containing protein, partial [Anaerolineales bacterium]|nr:PLxRFG domain-containing protein [Anaerolineales bacterium]
YEQSTDVVTSTEDILSGKISAQLKMVTVLGQLGGNIATALVNLTSIPMHTVPYLAYHNSVRGVGGGFGLGRATAEITMAGNNLKNAKFGTEVFLEDMVKNWPKTKKDSWVNNYGITRDEAEFLLQETRLGILSPAQFNALAGSARGGIEKAKTIKAIQVWMYPFTYTEQLNRRTTALATYRLYRARFEAAGITDPNQLRDRASEEANKAVDETQGNYDMYNRPQIARGNIFQYPFMYKQFVLTSVQLLAAMPWQGKVTYLGLMFLAAGLKGFPFADDLFDLIDTIAQMLGLRMGSIEMEAHKILDNIAPGASPFIMNGVLDRFSGATVSTRLGHGDLVPLTGAFRAGANFQREAVNLFGPVYAMFTGLAGMGKSTLRYGGEALGFKPDTTRINDILRESPIAALRAMSDGYAYNR